MEPDEALIEAVARRMFDDDCQADGVSVEDRDWLWADREEPVVSEIYGRKARAAHAAMVKHLGLTEEIDKTPDGFQGNTNLPRAGTTYTRYVTPWREVEP